MYSLKLLGLFDMSETKCTNWGQLVKQNLPGGDVETALRSFLTEKKIQDVNAAVDAIKWLGILGDIPLGMRTSCHCQCSLFKYFDVPVVFT